jgi:ABC-type transport system substrate-binding protein
MRTLSRSLLGLVLIGGVAAPAQAAKIVNVAYSEDMTTLDPALGYDIENWPVEHALFVTLLNYRDGTHLVPWAAADMPEVSDDGHVYTFKIKDGIKFSDGEPVDAQAFKYAIERILDPATQSPQGGTGGWFGNLEGAKDFIDGKAGSLSGIEVVDPLTIRFRLVEPDRSFLNILATPFASAEPKEAVEKWGKDYSHHVVASGPFTLESWVPGRSMVLKRNPDYFDPDSAAKLDEIDFAFNVNPQVALLRAQRAEVDVIGDDIPSAQFLAVANDPKYKDYLHSLVQVAVYYLFMNTQMAPFDDQKVRQAVNYAIDKKRLIQLLNGRGKMANQVLPPAMPGYDDQIRDIPHDPVKSRELLAAAGHPDGLKAELVLLSTPPWPTLGQAIQQQLSQAGIDLKLRTLPHAEYINTITTPGSTAIGLSAWFQDYPDPSDFLDVLFNSENIHPGAFTLSNYKNPEVDKLLDQARGLPIDKAVPLYQKAQRMIIDDAAWAPLYNPVAYKFASPRLKNLKLDPVWTFVYQDWDVE